LINAINKLNDKNVQCGAIQTTTKLSLDRPKELVEEYIKLGFNNIFLRPLTPLGYALNKWESIGYTTEQFLSFYKTCLEYIIEKNKSGYRIKEGHASIFLSKILRGHGVNYMELRSPCGAGIGQMAYYYDGNIYTCDEARMLKEMGDNAFCLGNVFTDDYNSLMDSKVCSVACKYTILEALPQCSDCAYMPYCGTCPVINYASEKDVISRSVSSYRCNIYKGMLDIIFEILMDSEKREVLEQWI
jgi:radical SAM protein with 4Fe4S-binding SPASM domain